MVGCLSDAQPGCFGDAGTAIGRATERDGGGDAIDAGEIGDSLEGDTPFLKPIVQHRCFSQSCLKTVSGSNYTCSFC